MATPADRSDHAEPIIELSEEHLVAPAPPAVPGPAANGEPFIPSVLPAPEEEAPPAVAPAGPPGPGFWAALGWTAVFLVFQVIVGIGIGVVLAVVGVALGEVSMTSGPGPAQRSLQEFIQQDWPAMALLVSATAGNLIFALGLTLLFYRGEWFRSLGLRLPHAGQFLIICLLVPPFQYVAVEVASWAALVLPDWGLNDSLIERLAQGPWVVPLIGGCLLPGIGEEIFSRGFLGRGLVARLGWPLGMLTASILFGILHVAPVHAVATTLLGLGFHFAYLTTKSLPASMWMHGLNNFFAFFLQSVVLRVHDVGVSEVKGVPHLPPGIAAASFGAALALGWVLFRMRTQWQLPDGRVWSPGYVTAELPPADLGAVARAGSPGFLSLAVAAVACLGFGLALYFRV
jgi:membrane protease YdiL (CAAX protease family)